jgi:hypothetical protein
LRERRGSNIKEDVRTQGRSSKPLL